MKPAVILPCSRPILFTEKCTVCGFQSDGWRFFFLDGRAFIVPPQGSKPDESGCLCGALRFDESMCTLLDFTAYTFLYRLWGNVA